MTATVDNMAKLATYANHLPDSVLFGSYPFASTDPVRRAVILDVLERRHPALRDAIDAVVLDFQAGAR